MREDLFELEKLMELLGYKDPRSVKKWCERNLIPILEIGVKQYILSSFLEKNIENQITMFAKSNKISPEQILARANSHNKVEDANTNLDITDLETAPKIIKSFKPQNEIVSKYLLKYEANGKSNTTKKTAA
ncbi:MAG: hypothetical protein ACXVP0_06435 [Bacteroidia bacterium]